MSKDKKITYLQLEKSYKIATKAKIKLELIERNKSTIFPCEEDYKNLKENYMLEREYAIKKCKDIVSLDKDLSSRKKWYDFFKNYYESKQLVKDIILLFIPFIALSFVLGYYYSESLLWLIASLDLIALGAGFGIYSYSMSRNNKKIVNNDRDYLAPNSMQIKVLKEIDAALLNGQIYEEIIKDCQLQFAKRRLAEKRTNNLTNDYKEEITNTENNVNIEEDVIDIFYGNEPKNKYSYSNKKKASDSLIYAKYMQIKNKDKKKENAPVVENISNNISSKKKASDSLIYAKYMQIKNENKKKTIVPDNGIRSEFSNLPDGTSSYTLSSYKDNKIIKKFVSSLEILHQASDSSITKEAKGINVKKKASVSPTYQRYMELKLAKQESSK